MHYAVFRISYHFKKMVNRTTRNLTERHRHRLRHYTNLLAISKHPHAYVESGKIMRLFLHECKEVIAVNIKFKENYLKICWIQNKFVNQLMMMGAKLEVLNNYWELVIN